MITVPIAFAFDDKIEMPAGVAITSFLSHAGKDTFYDIFILHADRFDFSRSPIHDLPKQYPNCRISFRSVKNEFVDGFEIRGITESCYYRLLIPELIPEYDKILYSDVDVIFREDLSKYFHIPLDGCYFASVNSVPVMNEDYLSYIKSRGMRPENGYYYSGNLIINSKKLLDDRKISEFRSHRKMRYRFQDMDIINLTCGGHIKPLPPSFCLTANYYEAFMSDRDRMRQSFTDDEIDDALKNGIVHYHGAKPWNTVCPNMDIWWDCYRKSIFFDERFTRDFWYAQTYRVERMSLWKRIKLVGRYFRKGGRK